MGGLRNALELTRMIMQVLSSKNYLTDILMAIHQQNQIHFTI